MNLPQQLELGLLERDLTQLWWAARPWYSYNSSRRKYHNWAHALAVTHTVYRIDTEADTATGLAAVWHDAVYVPNGGGDHNEVLSAQALYNEYRSRCVCSAGALRVVEEAMALIKQTTVAHHLEDVPRTGALATLLDADLHTLGAPEYQEFVKQQRNIIIEAGNVFDEQSKLHSALFLAKFLDKSTIYNTRVAQTLFGGTAYKNIARWMTETSQGQLP
jgi:predicted metal-dependent HD superfamily phosphohydrolase